MYNAQVLFVGLSFLILYIIKKYQNWQNVIKAIRDFPGLRFVYGSQSYVFRGRIPALAAGSFSVWTRKHQDFVDHDADIISSVSLLPSTEVTYLCADAEALKEITSARTRFPKPLGVYEHITLFGSNIVATEGDEWKRHRKIAASSFSERNNRLVWNESISTAKELFQEVWHGKDEVAIDKILDLTVPMALFIISAAGFGRRMSWKADIDVPPEHTVSFKDALHVVSCDLWMKVVLPAWVLNWVPIQRVQKFRVAYNELEMYMIEMIQDRRNSEKKEECDDLFNSLLDANEDESDGNIKLSDSELMGDISVFLIAGHETTAHTLAFAFVLLALYQDEQETLYQHIKSVVADGNDPSYEDMGKLTYCYAVLMETLRMFPSIIYIPKYAAEDTTLHTHNMAGEPISVPCPQGTGIAIHAPGLHYNPRYWKDPYEFMPSRFLGDWPRDAFLSFSGGPRGCLGRRFAEVEGVAVITYMISHYKIEVKEEPEFAAETFEQRKERLLKCDAGITLYPARAPLVFKRR